MERAKWPMPSSRTSGLCQRPPDGSVEVAHLGQVGKEFLDRKEAGGGRARGGSAASPEFEKVLDIGEEEIFFVAVVGIEGAPADAGAVEHLLHRDGFEGLLLHQRDKSVAQRVTGTKDARVGLLARADKRPMGVGGCIPDFLSHKGPCLVRYRDWRVTGR